MKFEDDETYDIAASTAPGNAMYLDYCEVAWHRPAYAACLRKIEERKAGRLDVRFAGCSAAIGKKVCPAMKMRAEELAAGQALHYINRAKLQAYSQYTQEMAGQAFATSEDGSNSRKARRAQRQQSTQDTAPKPQQIPVVSPEDGYAAAINAAIQKEAQPVAKAANDEVVKSEPRPAGSGLSMLEMARLKLNSKG